MKFLNIKSAFVATICTLLLAGCYKESNWLDENTTKGAGNYPVIATFTSTNGKKFKAGQVVKLDLRYWSLDPIKEIKFSSIIDGVTAPVSTLPYSANFAEDSQTDKLLFDYTVPSTPETVKKMKIEALITNENGLTRASTYEIELLFPLTCDQGPLTGTYKASTTATTPFDGPYDNTANPYTVTLTDLGSNKYGISDITGGLYKELYGAFGGADLYAEITRININDNAGGTVSCGIELKDWVDTVFPTPPNTFNATGKINDDGSITIDWSNTFGDVGKTILRKQ
jgi:hypothetical protein